MATCPQLSSHRASTAPALLAASLFALSCLGLPGCGRSAQPAAQPGAEAPASAAEESPKSASASETLEQAEAELEQARLQLAQLGGGLSARHVVPATEAAPAAGAPAPVAQAERKEKRAAAEPAPSPPPASRASRPDKSLDVSEDEGSARDQNPCTNACKAYASLLRAKDAVCRLDVPNGTRCARAEGIVRDATPQVQSCQCAP